MRPEECRPARRRICERLVSVQLGTDQSGCFNRTSFWPRRGGEISFPVAPDSFHAAGAAHGTLYFKMLDDAAFYAANGLVSDRFLLTTAFNLHFTKPMRGGQARAEVVGSRQKARSSSPRRGSSIPRRGMRRGTGTFMRSASRCRALTATDQVDGRAASRPSRSSFSNPPRRDGGRFRHGIEAATQTADRWSSW